MSTRFKTGDKVKVVKNTSSHSMPIGSEATIIRWNSSGTPGCWTVTDKNGSNWGAYDADLASFKTSREVLTEKVADLKAELEQVGAKLDFLTEIGSDEFDETEFKAFQVLKTVESGGLSLLEKARAIAKLVK